jgi:hypothetical protein
MPRPKKYYFITEQYERDGTQICNHVIDMHPIDWLSEKSGGYLSFYQEITKEEYQRGVDNCLDDED